MYVGYVLLLLLLYDMILLLLLYYYCTVCCCLLYRLEPLRVMAHPIFILLLIFGEQDFESHALRIRVRG